MALFLALGSVAQSAEQQSGPKPDPNGGEPKLQATNPGPEGTASIPNRTDSKPTTVDAQNLIGCTAEEVESALGKPSGKLQKATGPLWLYAQWRVQFDQKGKVHAVEKDQPMRLAKLDPRWVAASEATEKAAAQRAAAEDAARIKAAADLLEDVRTISNGGQEVDLAALLSDQRVTIVDFYAEWCGPCRKISPSLEKVAREDPDVVLLKLDIVNWDTPVTRQFGIQSVPSIRVFSRAKTQVGEARNDLAGVMEQIKKAKGS